MLMWFGRSHPFYFEDGGGLWYRVLSHSGEMVAAFDGLEKPSGAVPVPLSSIKRCLLEQRDAIVMKSCMVSWLFLQIGRSLIS